QDALPDMGEKASENIKATCSFSVSRCNYTHSVDPTDSCAFGLQRNWNRLPAITNRMSIRRLRPAASGKAVTAPATTLTKSRRRIAFPKAQDQANRIDDYSRDLRLTKWGLGAVCTAAILSRSCPLWVISGHRRDISEGLLFARRRTFQDPRVMSPK